MANLEEQSGHQIPSSPARQPISPINGNSRFTQKLRELQTSSPDNNSCTAKVNVYYSTIDAEYRNTTSMNSIYRAAISKCASIVNGDCSDAIKSIYVEFVRQINGANLVYDKKKFLLDSASKNYNDAIASCAKGPSGIKKADPCAEAQKYQSRLQDARDKLSNGMGSLSQGEVDTLKSQIDGYAENLSRYNELCGSQSGGIISGKGKVVNSNTTSPNVSESAQGYVIPNGGCPKGTILHAGMCIDINSPYNEGRPYKTVFPTSPAAPSFGCGNGIECPEGEVCVNGICIKQYSKPSFMQSHPVFSVLVAVLVVVSLFVFITRAK